MHWKPIEKMFIATRCLRAKTQNLARCPTTRDWTDQWNVQPQDRGSYCCTWLPGWTSHAWGRAVTDAEGSCCLMLSTWSSEWEALSQAVRSQANTSLPQGMWGSGKEQWGLLGPGMFCFLIWVVVAVCWDAENSHVVRFRCMCFSVCIFSFDTKF